MRLSRSTAYAISALLDLSDYRTDSPISCSRLASDSEMCEKLLLRILQRLSQDGVLEVARGVEDGYTLTRPLHEITLLDVADATNGRDAPFVPATPSLRELVRLRLLDALTVVAARASEALASTSLADIRGDTNGSVR